jgi:hypothetical protein
MQSVSQYLLPNVTTWAEVFDQHVPYNREKRVPFEVPKVRREGSRDESLSQWIGPYCHVTDPDTMYSLLVHPSPALEVVIRSRMLYLERDKITFRVRGTKEGFAHITASYSLIIGFRFVVTLPWSEVPKDPSAQ